MEICEHLDQRGLRTFEEVREAHRHLFLKAIALRMKNVVLHLHSDVSPRYRNEPQFVEALSNWAKMHGFVENKYCPKSLADWVVAHAQETLQKWSRLGSLSEKNVLDAWVGQPPDSEGGEHVVSVAFHWQLDLRKKPAAVKRDVREEFNKHLNSQIDRLREERKQTASPAAVKRAENHYYYLALQIRRKWSGRRVAKHVGRAQSVVNGGISAALESMGFRSIDSEPPRPMATVDRSTECTLPVQVHKVSCSWTT